MSRGLCHSRSVSEKRLLPSPLPPSNGLTPSPAIVSANAPSPSVGGARRGWKGVEKGRGALAPRLASRMPLPGENVVEDARNGPDGPAGQRRIKIAAAAPLRSATTANLILGTNARAFAR